MPVSKIKKLIKSGANDIILSPVIPSGNGLDNYEKIAPKFSEIKQKIISVIKSWPNISIVGFPKCIVDHACRIDPDIIDNKTNTWTKLMK